MTDKESQFSQPPRRHAYANRARQGQNRIYQHLGVRDLREIIDRKREGNHPHEGDVPPDPSFNYLKDSLRENVEQEIQESSRQFNIRKYKNCPSNSFRRYKEYPKGHTGQTSMQGKTEDIENPLNIKVEFSTSTGEHSYKFDESTVLPTIKHVPDHTPGPNRSLRGRGRGRGRGHGRGPRSYHTRTIRNNKHLSNKSGSHSTQVPVQISVDTEENWDNEFHEAKVASEDGALCDHECPDLNNCDICENVQESVHDHVFTDEGDHQDQGEIGLETDVENLKLIVDSSALKNTNKEKEEPIK